MSMSEDVFIILPDPEPSEDFLKNLPRDSKELKKALRVEQDTCGVQVFAVAVHHDFEKNKPLEIPAAFGSPLSDDVYDTVRDSYHVEGVDFFEVGMVPVNYRIYLEDTIWQVDVPLPFSLIKKYLTDSQKEAFEKWKAAYKSGQYTIQFLQVTGLF